jgi:hypothetical protein
MFPAPRRRTTLATLSRRSGTIQSTASSGRGRPEVCVGV